MSISCEAYIGYTVTLKTDLSCEDFNFFDEFIEKHKEYNLYDCKGKVLLAVDGMRGTYARLVFVDEHIEDCWFNGKDYYKLKSPLITDTIYDELNRAYTLMYNKQLDKNSVEYALWAQFG